MSHAPDRQPLRLRTKVLLGVVLLVTLVGLAELALNLVAPARFIDCDVLEAQAQQHSGTMLADPVLGHVPVLDGPTHDRFGLLRRWGPRGSVAAKREGVVRLLLLGDAVAPGASIASPLRELWLGTAAEPEFAEFLTGASRLGIPRSRSSSTFVINGSWHRITSFWCCTTMTSPRPRLPAFTKND